VVVATVVFGGPYLRAEKPAKKTRPGRGTTPPCPPGGITVVFDANGKTHTNPTPCTAKRDDIIKWHVVYAGTQQHVSMDESNYVFLSDYGQTGGCKQGSDVSDGVTVDLYCQVMEVADNSYRYDPKGSVTGINSDPEIEVQGGPDGRLPSP